MVLRESTWRPAGRRSGCRAQDRAHQPAPCAITAESRPAAGSWPSFRGPQASGVADGQHLPDAGTRAPARTSSGARRFPASRTRARSSGAIASSSTSAISSEPNATFKPGLYGDGDASDDRSPHAGCSTRSTSARGKIAWERVALRGRAAQQAAHQVHLRERHARHRRPHRRRLVRIAGRPRLRRERQRRCGRSISAASTWAPTTSRRYEWGPASSPIIWNGLVHPAVRHAGRLVPARARRRDRRDGLEDGSRGAAVVGHADGRDDAAGRELVTNASNFIRGYDPRNGQGAVAARRQLEDHGADADLRRRPARRRERPRGPSGRSSPCAPARAATSRCRAARPAATPSPGARPAAARTCRRRSPTTGMLYVLANNGVFDAYDLQTGEEIYRQRLPNRRQRLQRVARRGRRQDLPVERGRRDARHRRGTRVQARSRRTRWASC